MAPARKPLDRVRRIIRAWPETDERISHGSPTFWGGKKTFASFHDNHHGDERLALWIKSKADPDRFFVPPYVGPSGWIGARLDRKPDWALIATLLEAGYRSVAPKRALKALEALATSRSD